jgi:hypothetical protein
MPPPRPLSSFPQIPWLYNTSSFANSFEHRKYVDDVLKEELGTNRALQIHHNAGRNIYLRCTILETYLRATEEHTAQYVETITSDSPITSYLCRMWRLKSIGKKDVEYLRSDNRVLYRGSKPASRSHVCCTCPTDETNHPPLTRVFGGPRRNPCI